MIDEIKEIKEVCKLLMETNHYGKLGPAGIFAIIQKCNAVGIQPMEGLNGGMYYVGGKVELSSVMMNSLIRKAGHSITCKENTAEICTLLGKRSDNSDEWISSFTMEDAKRAGLLRSPIWSKYPDIMLYNRALSKLARQLFPDVIGGCYIEGEIPIEIEAEVMEEKEESVNVAELHEEGDPVRGSFEALLKAKAIKSLTEVPKKFYEKVKAKNEGEKNESA